MNTYARLPVAFTRGEGVWLWDTAGRRYLDALSGIAVCGLGHAHPRLTAAICQQAGTLIHTSNLYEIPKQEELAARLAQLSGMEQAFFCNSGAEANEAAIKVARMYGHQRGIDMPAIIVMERSFHGRTLATLTATGNRKVQAGFEPLLTGFVRVPYGDINAVRQVAAHNANVVAVLVEPIQGEGGINIPPADYLPQLRALCTEQQWLLMVDEVQSGIGRSGKWFAHQHTGITPDVMTLAKGLGNGLPIGACLVQGPAAGVFKPGSHGSTFGGTPLACTAALTTLAVIDEDHLCERATQLGERITSQLRQSLANVPGVTAIRNLGLLIGIELDRPCGALVTQALAAGLLINVTADKVVRLLPPLIMTDAEADQLVAQLAPMISQFLKQNAQ